MSDDSVTLDGGKNVDIDREVADIRNFIGYKSAKVVESVEEETLDEGKFKVGDTVIPSVGPHKGRKHEVIADLKNNTYNIKPIGLLAKQIQYRLGAAKAKANQIKLVKEETLDEGKMKELAMKIAQVYSNMKKDKNMRSFADKFRKDVAKSLDIRKSLEKVLPDYVAGKDITNIMSKHVPGHKEEGLDEKVSYVEYKFKNARDAGAAKKYFDAQQRMSFDVNDDNMRGGELMVDAGKNDMTQFHKEVMKKFRPKVMSTEAKLIDKPTGEVLKTGSKKEMETEKKRNRDELQVKEQSNGTKGE
jgi:hypothetical protein